MTEILSKVKSRTVNTIEKELLFMTKKRKIFHIILIVLLEINAILSCLHTLIWANYCNWNWLGR